MLNGNEMRALRWSWQNTDITVLQEITHRTSSMAAGIVMLEGHVRMSLREGYHMREEDVFLVMHGIEVACNLNTALQRRYPPPSCGTLLADSS